MNDNDKLNEGYTPIDCDLYSEYEVAILHREILRLHWHDEAGISHIERVIPTDLQTRDHCEYLLAEACADKGAEGKRLEIRLDRIISKESEQ